MKILVGMIDEIFSPMVWKNFGAVDEFSQASTKDLGLDLG
jgi:hypothetical protein